MAKRVLFLPHNVRRDYFLAFLRRAKDVAGWRIGVIAPAAAHRFYAGIVDKSDYFLEPDLTRSMNWETNAAERARIAGIIEECEGLSGISANLILLTGERNMGRAYSRESHSARTG